MVGTIAGNSGVIIRAINGGRNMGLWLLPVKENLNSVHFLNLNIGMVAGTNGCVAMTTDGGASWKMETTGITTNLRSCQVLSTTKQIAVGDGSTLIRSTDGGLHWHSISIAGVAGDFWTVAFTDSNRGFVAGSNGTLLHTRDGGATWFIPNAQVSPSKLINLTPGSIDSRFGLLVGSLFAAIANQYVVSNSLPLAGTKTLADTIHQLAYMVILLCLGLSLLSLRCVKKGREALSQRIDRWGFGVLLAGYMTVVTAVVARAIARG